MTKQNFEIGERIVPCFLGTVAPEGPDGGTKTHVRNEFLTVKQSQSKGNNCLILLKSIDGQLRWFDAGLFKRLPL